MELTVSRVATLEGRYRPPSDKSLTHRSYLFASIANGACVVRKPLGGEDCRATLRCMEQMGLSVEELDADTFRLHPPRKWMQPNAPLDCGNSGTTMRLLAGLVASRRLDCTLVGDASLSRRPMARIAEPLRLMGAEVEGSTPPIRIVGNDLAAINYNSPVASGQIKSCTLLAGLRASGTTAVTEPSKSRDHTERMLRAMGVSVSESDGPSGHTASLAGGQVLSPFEMTIPGDISSAAFLLVAAAIVPKARLDVTDLSVNPSRTGILDVLAHSGVGFAVGEPRMELGEPVADLTVRSKPDLSPYVIEGSLVPRLIDEIPVLCVLATQCHGVSVIRGAQELRVKESDRIESISQGLRAMGAEVETHDDGLSISGPTPLRAARIEAKHDHRIAMAFAIAGLIADGVTVIDGAESIATSYPDFENDLMRLCIV